MQLTAMRQYARKRGWEIAVEVKDIGSGASLRQKREELLVLARKKEGKPHGRPLSAALHLQEMKDLFSQGVSKREIAKQLRVSQDFGPPAP